MHNDIEKRIKDVTTLPFTGERVVPGAVDPDLWNEHIARYQFASTFCFGKTALDVGCGTAYGVDLLSGSAALAVGFDLSFDAISYGSSRYLNRPHLFVGSGDAFPFSSHTFDLITCFEVIEHLQGWRLLIEECVRVLAPGGIVLVSTPNKSYYSEARSTAGPNPFHVHEFDLLEFESALRRCFSFVCIMAQNQQEAIVFADDESKRKDTAGFIAVAPGLPEAQFFVAMCGQSERDPPSFTYVAQAGNRLKDREHHIKALQAELIDLRSQLQAARTKLDQLHTELADRTEWARSIEREKDQETARVLEMQSSIWFRVGDFCRRFRGSVNNRK